MKKKTTKIKTYRAAPGAGYNDKQAEIIGKRLEKIGSGNHEDVTPELIVNDAKQKASPLHRFFTWDDTDAANAWRLHQARNLVNHLRVVIITTGGEIETKAFHSIVTEANGDEGEKVYRPVAHMVGPSEEQIRAQVLESAKNELESWRKRYAEYENVFSEVFHAIDKILSVSKAA